jgi:SAM-dependent methyltransferase
MGDPDRKQEALDWQTGVWNRMADVYVSEIDARFEPVIDALIRRANLRVGEHVLDVGTGTGSVALKAASIVGPSGLVVATDISPEMLDLARRRVPAAGHVHLRFMEGRAESLPARDSAFDVVLACLSMMYVIEREAAAHEIARVLKPNGRFVAAVWGGADECDIVRFQESAGRFAGPPPVPHVGPGALADPGVFLAQLQAAGIRSQLFEETLGFDFPDFASAWNTLAGVTTAQLSDERRQEAKDAVLAVLYPEGDGPRRFRNVTRFIVGVRTS